MKLKSYFLVIFTFAFLVSCQNINDSSNEKYKSSESKISSVKDLKVNLQDYFWTFKINKEIKTSFDLDFIDKKNILIKGLCNNISGSYSIDKNKIQFSHLIGTMMLCSNLNLISLEQQINDILWQANKFEIIKNEQGKNILKIYFPDNKFWEFEGKIKLKELYGEPKQVFIEVASNKVKCRNNQCLLVRAINYDSSGLKTKEGQWQEFNGEIDGFNHKEGVRNILRLWKYEDKKNNSEFYTLDMIVESEFKN